MKFFFKVLKFLLLVIWLNLSYCVNEITHTNRWMDRWNHTNYRQNYIASNVEDASCTPLSSPSREHRNHEGKGHFYQGSCVGRRNNIPLRNALLHKVFHEMQMYKRHPNLGHFVRIQVYQEMSCPGIPAITRISNYPCNSHQMFHPQNYKSSYCCN